MEGIVNEHYAEEYKKMKNRYLNNERGIALITALLISVVIMLMASATLYFITQSTIMSGAGKRYATADEAANGAVDVAKDAIKLVMRGEQLPSILPSGSNLSNAILNEGVPSGPITISLPGTIGSYTARITVTRLYSVTLPGSRLEFAAAAGGPASTAVFYRIETRVEGPNKELAENSALYRFAE